jgi:hypothetical protein
MWSFGIFLKEEMQIKHICDRSNRKKKLKTQMLGDTIRFVENLAKNQKKVEMAKKNQLHTFLSKIE